MCEECWRHELEVDEQESPLTTNTGGEKLSIRPSFRLLMCTDW